MKKILIIILFQAVALHADGQNPSFSVSWDNGLGGSMEDVVTIFHQLPDSGFILAGSSYSAISGDKSQFNYDPTLATSDFWLIRTDSSGQKIWDKRYGAGNEENLLDVILTNDGGYLAAGNSYSGIGGDKTQPNWDPTLGSMDYWIIKINASGVKQWDKRIGGTSFDLFSAVRQTADGGYILAGTSFSGINGNKTELNEGGYDYWLVRTDSLGNIIWDRTFGGTMDDFSTSLDLSADGNFLVGGYSNSQPGGDKTQPSQGSWDYWVVKVDTLGNKMWDKTFGGNYQDYLFSFTLANDGGFLLGGQSFSEAGGDKTDPNHDPTPGSSDYWIVKINSSGTKLWDRTIGASETEELSRLVQTTDHGFLLSGESYSPVDGDKTEPNLGPEQSWIVKTDSMGFIDWDKTIFTYGHDELGGAIQVSEYCYLVVNYTFADTGGYKTEMSQGLGDYWMLKFCANPPVTVYENLTEFEEVKLFPNPVNDHLSIFIKNPDEKIYNVEVVDLSGRIVLSEPAMNNSGKQSMEINMDLIKSGAYICRVTTNKKIVNLRFIKL